MSIAQAPSVLKAIAFFLAWGVFWLPLAIPLAVLLKWRPSQPLEVKQKLFLMASLYLIAPLIVWGASFVEGASFFDYGLGCKEVTCNILTILGSLGLGLGLGIVSLAVVFSSERGFGWVKWRWEDESQPQNVASLVKPILLPTFLLALWISGTEELIFRGYLLNQLQQDHSTWIAAAISSLIFALAHLVWEQQKTLPQLPGLWLMGMVLAIARWVDGGNLALAWGLHTGWVWAIATLDTAELITYTGKGSVWMTGFAEKPLAGGAGIFCLLATGSILWSFFS